ncbi:MAG: hypothetical protein RLZ25_2000 [Pseudomonadota bacterium]|jgi:hypothetical protein
MNGKSLDSKTDWVDSDDAPELTQDFFDHAEWRVGERSVSPAVGIAAIAKATFRGKPPLEPS